MGSKLALNYQSIFLGRRIYTAIILVLIYDYPVQQIQLLMISSLINLYYLILVKPFETKGQNILEIFNEICIVICIYHIIVFSDFTDDPYLKYDLGWSLNGIALCQILVNTIYILFGTVKNLILNLRKQFQKCSRKTKTKELKKYKIPETKAINNYQVQNKLNSATSLTSQLDYSNEIESHSYNFDERQKMPQDIKQSKISIKNFEPYNNFFKSQNQKNQEKQSTIKLENEMKEKELPSVYEKYFDKLLSTNNNPHSLISETVSSQMDLKRERVQDMFYDFDAVAYDADYIKKFK
ncbi:UNKNOWN [Stylonychia lemnae]|uniref:Transmembrane protein n=1 Tax=Stylonychia lemnae TaxID=5949 RepID=A0A078B4T3_STYLE|nr:UNKNOWN [Stylonychia lemnae]|eukprot:CDW89271.1 UNKNOWN [Stylonychia lemnae]